MDVVSFFSHSRNLFIAAILNRSMVEFDDLLSSEYKFLGKVTAVRS